MKPQIKTVITYMLLLLFVSGCGTSKAGVTISETDVIQAAYSASELSQQEVSNEDTENIAEDTELFTKHPEDSTKQPETYAA